MKRRAILFVLKYPKPASNFDSSLCTAENKEGLLKKSICKTKPTHFLEEANMFSLLNLKNPLTSKFILEEIC